MGLWSESIKQRTHATILKNSNMNIVQDHKALAVFKYLI